MILKQFIHYKPISLLTLAYIVGLSLIAGMSIGAHLVVKRVTVEQEASARTINIAGRQRMLSQRMALYMTDAIVNDRVAAKNKLRESINLFERSHEALLKGNAELRLSGQLDPQLQYVYFREPYHVDQLVRQYIEDVRTILAHADNGLDLEDPVFLRAKKLAEGDLLIALDVAVKTYEEVAERKIAKLVDIQELAVLALLVILLLEALIIFHPLITRVKKYSRKMEEIATIDSLTGTLNRRAIFELIEREISRSKRYKYDCALIICDIDFFKKINDTYGHQIGDEALQHFASLLQKAIRKEDVLGRFGGEEFLILLPQTKHDNAVQVAEKLRGTIEAYPLHFQHEGEKKQHQITASFGLTMLDPFADNKANDLYARADKALYEAKETGRNKVIAL